MRAAASAQDYRQKERQEWTVWDWLCALKDGLTGQGPEPEDEQLQALRGTLFALTALKTLDPPCDGSGPGGGLRTPDSGLPAGA